MPQNTMPHGEKQQGMVDETSRQKKQGQGETPSTRHALCHTVLERGGECRGRRGYCAGGLRCACCLGSTRREGSTAQQCMQTQRLLRGGKCRHNSNNAMAVSRSNCPVPHNTSHKREAGRARGNMSKNGKTREHEESQHTSTLFPSNRQSHARQCAVCECSAAVLPGIVLAHAHGMKHPGAG